MRRIEAAVASRGMKSLSDINETAEDGFFATPLSQDRERASSARCYLTPEVRRRPNLKIITSTSVRNLRIENGRVCGVVAERDDETVILSASEVVVCAGAASPPAGYVPANPPCATSGPTTGRRLRATSTPPTTFLNSLVGCAPHRARARVCWASMPHP